MAENDQEQQTPRLAGKRGNHFDFLSDDEVESMEQAIQSSYGTCAPDDE